MPSKHWVGGSSPPGRANISGHYDDVIEERERAEHEARASALGITPEELARRDAHRERMIRGKRLFERRVQEESDMEYYLNHRHEPY